MMKNAVEMLFYPGNKETGNLSKVIKGLYEEWRYIQYTALVQVTSNIQYISGETGWC